MISVARQNVIVYVGWLVLPAERKEFLDASKNLINCTSPSFLEQVPVIIPQRLMNLKHIS